MDLKSTYNKIARDWAKDHGRDSWWVAGTDQYLSYLRPGAPLLDVGCGAGVKSKYLVGKGFEVTGIDFSREMITLAKAQVPEGSFFIKDIKQPLGLDSLFDGIFAQAVLLHIPKAEVGEVLKNITEFLKPGGYLYVAVKEVRPGGKEEEIKIENDYGYTYERFFSYFTIGELRDFVESAGFEVTDEIITPSGATNWIQLVAKKLSP